MSVISNPPYPSYFDVDGSPLENGYLYFGAANQNPETNPITVYWDSAYLVPAAQPIRTSGGFAVRNGSPANVYVTTDYSLTVRDKNLRLVYSKLLSEGQTTAEVNIQFSTQTVIATSGQTVFNLSTAYTPGNQSLAVYHNGARLVVAQDYTETSATVVTLLIGATVGDVLQFVTATPINPSSLGAAAVAYVPAGAGAVATDVQTVLRETVSVTRFGADNTGTTNCYQAVEAAWQHCLANGKDLYFPSGIYRITSENNFPFGRINGLPPTSLLDCKNITIFGDGPTTILRTDTINGGDVIQLNGAKNLHIRNLYLTATISGSGAGSNGVSVTGGYDNITLDHIWCENLPSLDKTTYVDGGKALTIQTPASGQTVVCGTLKATNIFAKGCVYGFGFELDLVAASTMDTSVDVDIVAEDCREAVIVSAGAATGAIPANWSMGVRVKAQAINCMTDVTLGRAHGVDVECQVITTKTRAQRILNYAGVKWFAADTVAKVVGLLAAYAHNCNVTITGNKGECASIAQIGGISTGSSGLSASSLNSRFELGLRGTSVSGDIVEIDAGGNVANSCTFICYGSGSPSAAFYLPSRNNTIVFGNLHTLKDLSVQGAVKFTYTDGVNSYGEINYDDEAVTFRQTLGSSASLRVVKVLNNSGSTVFAMRNDGYLSTAGRVTASAVATVKGVLPIYDEANAFYGYVPVYTSYTP
jgi:hypothetical protein